MVVDHYVNSVHAEDSINETNTSVLVTFIKHTDTMFNARYKSIPEKALNKCIEQRTC